MSVQAARTIHLSYTAPSLPSPMVWRPHLISTIVQLFDANTDIVCVESRPGYGKTTLLREFAETCDGPCFSVFLRAASRHSYDPALARADLANQLNWHLESRRLTDDHEPSDSQLRTLLNRCTRKLSRRNANAYFLIDGLDHIPAEDDALLQAIMNLIPFGIRPFRFLFSCDNSTNIFRHHRTLQVKPFVLPVFNSHETDEFLSDILDDKSLRSDYHNALGGVPVLLASARRQLQLQANVETTPALSLPPELDKFLEAEWRLHEPLSESVETVLCYLLAYGRPVSAPQLSVHTRLEANELENILKTLPFLTYSANLGGWEFSSEPFRDFADTKLRQKVKKVTETIATRLLRAPDSDEALALLPQFLQRIGDANKILDWFDEERFARILLQSRTPAWTEPILRNAIVLSHDARNDRALTTYSILRSIVPQITNTTGIEHEIRARCALGDIEGAQAVANAAPLLSQRLRLLAVLVDAASDQPGIAIQPLKEDLRALVSKIDLAVLQKEEAIDLAIDLYPVDQRLALRVLKSALKDDEEDGSFEIAMARITVAALQSKQSGQTAIDRDESTPKSTAVLVDERVQKFIDATKLSLTANSATEVLSLANRIEESSEKLFILRKWIDQHRTEDDVLEVVESAINHAILARDFTPTATFYREILEPLPYAADKIRRLKLIAMVDAQSPLMRSKGPTIDYVRVQLLLASCHCDEQEWENAGTRLEDLYLDCIATIENIETRTACLSWSLAHLERHDPSGSLDAVSQFRAVVESEFGEWVNRVLNDCAEQYTILEKSLEALALCIPRRGLDLCTRLNTATRKTEALFYFVKVIARDLQATEHLEVAFEAIDLLTPSPSLDDALNVVGERIARNIRTGMHWSEDLERWLARLPRCTSATEKCESLGKVAAALSSKGEESDRIGGIADEMLSEFDRIRNPRDRYTMGCKLIVLLHRRAPIVARRIYELLSRDNEVSRLSENVEDGSYYILGLLTKASCALSRAGLLRSADVRRICSMVGGLPDVYMRVRLFSRLAFFYWREGETAHFASIVNEHIWSELDSLADGDQELLFTSWIDAYGVVWLENRDRARSTISSFPESVRHSCVRNLCFSLLYRLPPGEPVDGRGKSPSSSLTYSDIHNLLILCEEVDDDVTIFGVLEGIADQIEASGYVSRLTRDQKAEIGRLMHEVAESRLPSTGGVQHPGYRIVAHAQALRVVGGGGDRWQELVSEGSGLENLADRVFVNTLLASYLPKKMRARRRELFAAAESEAKTLGSIEDGYQRYTMLARVSMESDRALASRSTENAFRTLTASGDVRYAAREQRLVDLAYSVDPELPIKLAVLYDDDPARDEYRKRARDQIRRLELRRELADVKGDIALRNRQNDPDLAVAAWQSLGALNAGRMVAVDMNRARDMLACASNYPLETAYPMYSWVLSNVMDKYASTPQAARYIRDLFEGIARGARFFFMVTGSAERFEFNPKWHYRDEQEVHAVIHSGERARAVEFLRRWFANNVDDVITIVDPYFGPDDLWVVRLVMEANASAKVRIVTGVAEGRESEVGTVPEAYRSSWRNLCDQDPPYTEVLRVSFVESGKTPIHDRWVLSKAAGLRIGTSFNSIGAKLTELSAIDSRELDRVQESVGGYLNRNIKKEDGQRVTYELFELLP